MSIGRGYDTDAQPNRIVIGGIIILTNGVAQTLLSVKDDTELSESEGSHG
jgi:hypothetical protein